MGKICQPPSPKPQSQEHQGDRISPCERGRRKCGVSKQPSASGLKPVAGRGLLQTPLAGRGLLQKAEGGSKLVEKISGHTPPRRIQGAGQAVQEDPASGLPGRHPLGNHDAISPGAGRRCRRWPGWASRGLTCSRCRAATTSGPLEHHNAVPASAHLRGPRRDPNLSTAAPSMWASSRVRVLLAASARRTRGSPARAPGPRHRKPGEGALFQQGLDQAAVSGAGDSRPMARPEPAAPQDPRRRWAPALRLSREGKLITSRSFPSSSGRPPPSPRRPGRRRPAGPPPASTAAPLNPRTGYQQDPPHAPYARPGAAREHPAHLPR